MANCNVDKMFSPTSQLQSLKLQYRSTFKHGDTEIMQTSRRSGGSSLETELKESNLISFQQVSSLVRQTH